MQIDLRQLDGSQLEDAATHYAEHGYVLLSGLDDSVTSIFRRTLAALIDADQDELSRFLDTASGLDLLPLETRKRLARVDTLPRLAESLLHTLQQILVRLIGPLAHVSSTFHCQVKGAPVKEVQRGGYAQEYLEVQGAYLLHQDFTGASIPTSPSGLTLWVGMNSSADWNLRLFPGSHKLGLLCDRWLKHDDRRVADLEEPIDLPAQEGSAVLFNALLLHGTSNPGPLRRVSCDIRFFPLCGFLPSNVHLIGTATLDVLRQALSTESDDVLRAPLLEDSVFLGQDVPPQTLEPTSVLNWVQYIAHIARGEHDDAIPFLHQFANASIGADSPEAYIDKFHGKPLYEAPLCSMERLLNDAAPGTPELAGLGKLIASIG